MSDWLECEHCGADVLESDADGMYWEGNCAICEVCGCESSVSVDDSGDDPRAHANTSEPSGRVSSAHAKAHAAPRSRRGGLSRSTSRPSIR